MMGKQFYGKRKYFVTACILFNDHRNRSSPCVQIDLKQTIKFRNSSMATMSYLMH